MQALDAVSVDHFDKLFEFADAARRPKRRTTAERPHATDIKQVYIE